MKATRVTDLFFWSVYQPDRRIDFNGFYWRRPDGGVLIDPMPLSEEIMTWLQDQPGGIAWIVLTNADHVRDAIAMRERFRARIVAPDGDRALLQECADDWYGPESPLPEPLAATIGVHWLHGGKTDAEAVLHLRPLGALLFGDAVRSHESGRLRLLPDAKIAYRDRLIADVLALRALDFEVLLLGDGDSLFTGAAAAFATLVDEPGGSPGD